MLIPQVAVITAVDLDAFRFHGRPFLYGTLQLDKRKNLKQSVATIARQSAGQSFRTFRHACRAFADQRPFAVYRLLFDIGS